MDRAAPGSSKPRRRRPSDFDPAKRRVGRRRVRAPRGRCGSGHGWRRRPYRANRRLAHSPTTAAVGTVRHLALEEDEPFGIAGLLTRARPAIRLRPTAGAPGAGRRRDTWRRTPSTPRWRRADRDGRALLPPWDRDWPVPAARSWGRWRQKRSGHHRGPPSPRLWLHRPSMTMGRAEPPPPPPPPQQSPASESDAPGDGVAGCGGYDPAFDDGGPLHDVRGKPRGSDGGPRRV